MHGQLEGLLCMAVQVGHCTTVAYEVNLLELCGACLLNSVPLR